VRARPLRFKLIVQGGQTLFTKALAPVHDPINIDRHTVTTASRWSQWGGVHYGFDEESPHQRMMSIGFNL
jgi:hypothetical protein